MYFDNRFIPKHLPSSELWPKESSDPAASVTFQSTSTIGNELFLIVPPWNNHPTHMRRFGSQLAKTGANVLLFNIRPDALSASIESTVEMHEAAADIIAARSMDAQDTLEPSRTTLMSFSLGVVAGSMALERGLKVERAILTTPGDELATSLWSSERTKHIKTAIEKQGVSLDQLRRRWSRLAPRNYVDYLAGADVDVVLSQRDLFVPYHLGKQLADAIENTGANVKVKSNDKLGHVLTILRELYFPGMLR